MWVQEIWRYPVKSMAGESLQTAELTEQGIKGDRIVQVWDLSGRIVTARTRPKLLGHRGTLGPDGEPRVMEGPGNLRRLPTRSKRRQGKGCVYFGMNPSNGLTFSPCWWLRTACSQIWDITVVDFARSL